MKKIGRFLKKIIIVYISVFVTLCGMSQCLARPYDAACGEYVANYAEEFIKKYGGDSRYLAQSECSWDGGSFGNGTFVCCCTSGVKYMYELALGINLYDYGYSAWASGNLNITDEFWEKISISEAKPGDILVREGHVEMATSAGARDHANFGSGGPSAVMHYNASDAFTIAIRLKNNVDVNPNGTIVGSSGGYNEELDSIYGANGFIYQGVATLSGYESGGTLGQWLFDTLLKILDWIIGLLTYLIRVVIVGWIVIIERVFIDGIVNTVTGIDNTAEPENSEPEETEEAEETTEEEPLEPIGDESNPEEYIGTGVQAVANVGQKAKITTSSKANVTVENIVFNRVPILDANFFNFETALTVDNNEGNAFNLSTTLGNDGEGIKVLTAQLDENGIVYLLKVSIAMWYYTIRILAIAAMLLVLIYLGIKMAFSTVAEGKAVYKEMLLGWVTGFILIFVMHYIMYAVLLLNEGIVSWIASTQVEGGNEISLYETVRSKAYEIKASSGWSGTIMYLILVYYAIKFLLIYIKRYFTIAVLAVFSPMVALSCAIEKINKSGKKSSIYGMWLKDFIYTTLLQSAHALIYVVFIGTALKLTEASLMGIALSLVFLHFMSNAEEILRKIMSFTNQPSDIMNQPMRPNLAAITVGGMSAKKLTTAYAKGVNKVVLQPAGRAINRGVSFANDRVRNLIGSGDERQAFEAGRDANAALTDLEDRKNEKEKEIKAKRKEDIKKALKIAGKGTLATAGLVGGMAGLVIEPAVGLSMLGKSASSFMDISASIDNIRGPKKALKGKRYTFNGVRIADERLAEQLRRNLERDGIEYTERRGVIVAGNTRSQRRKYKRKYLKSTQRGIGRAMTGALKLATGVTLVNEIKDIGRNRKDLEEDVRAKAVVDLYSRAQKKEKDIIKSYKEARNRQDELISAIERTNPDVANRLRVKQDAEMEQVMLALANPLATEDVENAVNRYISRNSGAFEVDLNSTISLSSEIDRHVRGISNELNAVLEQRESKVRVGEEFAEKLKVKLSQMEEGIKIDDEPEEPSRPSDSRNAPRQNAALKVEDLVEAIQSSAKEEGAVEIQSDLRVESLEAVVKKLVELEDFNVEAEKLGEKPIYDVEDIIRKLKTV